MGIILFVVAIIWLIVTLNRKINKALKKSAEILNFQTDIPRNILRKKKIFGELDGYRCEVEVFTRSHGRSSTTYVSFYAYFPNSCLLYTSPSPRDATLSRMPSSA